MSIPIVNGIVIERIEWDGKVSYIVRPLSRIKPTQENTYKLASNEFTRCYLADFVFDGRSSTKSTGNACLARIKPILRDLYTIQNGISENFENVKSVFALNNTWSKSKIADIIYHPNMLLTETIKANGAIEKNALTALYPNIDYGLIPVKKLSAKVDYDNCGILSFNSSKCGVRKFRRLTNYKEFELQSKLGEEPSAFAKRALEEFSQKCFSDRVPHSDASDPEINRSYAVIINGTVEAFTMPRMELQILDLEISNYLNDVDNEPVITKVLDLDNLDLTPVFNQFI